MILWLALVFVLLLALGLALSYKLTQRASLKEVHTPADYGLPFEEISFQTADGLTLRGWLVPGSDPERVVVILHGHGGSIDYDVQYIPYLHAAGYNVLQFDFRGHGRSQGNVVTLGYLERMDVQAAVKFLLGRGLRRIALHGFSQGGMVAITAAPVCPEVAVVIDDGAPVRLRTAMRGWGQERHVPAALIPALAFLVIGAASLRLGANLFRYEPVRWVGKIAPRPLMLIHGERDPYVVDFDDLLKAAHPTEVWRLPAEGHVTASINLRDEYWQRVISFLQKNL
jgi:fermentation-respiration switch protein FrsA (DUF1100 family)